MLVFNTNKVHSRKLQLVTRLANLLKSIQHCTLFKEIIVTRHVKKLLTLFLSSAKVNKNPMITYVLQ